MRNSGANSLLSNSFFMEGGAGLASARSVAAASPQVLNDEMRKTANELLDSMQDSRFSETEVSAFLK